MTTYTSQRLPAEWEPQSFVQLTWPHEDTDWAPYLKEAQQCFLAIAKEIVKREDLLIVAPNTAEVKEQLLHEGILNNQTNYSIGETGALICSTEKHDIVLYECPTNDTWARDHAFITTIDSEGEPALNDFCFNGWGQKFASNKDNMINECLYLDKIIRSRSNDNLPIYADNRKIVLEGGSIESDGTGTLLTTSSCLFSPNRNWFEDKKEAEVTLQELGGKHTLWLDHGYLCGDDTDGHIDTLARLCPNDTIVYEKSSDENDIDYEELQAMEKELLGFRTAEGKAYRLIPLPIPEPIYEEDGYRLPATYANFLIINGAVLMPTYRQPSSDKLALKTLQEVFPDREVIGIDCYVLIRQHGSLHCVTMQFPESVILAK